MLDRWRVLWWNMWYGLTNMTPTQMILYAFILLVLVLYVRRRLQLRGLKTYSPKEAAERMGQPGSTILLDVRTTGERERKSIKGSIHIPLHEIGRRANELEKHKNKEFICYCQSGSRSISAAAQLKKLGFRVANMSGGIAEWSSSGLQ